MIQAFLPPPKRSAHARIVNVSSGAGSYADPVFALAFRGGAAARLESAKLLWSALTSTLAAELAATPVIVNAVCTGLTRPTQAQPAMGARPVAQSAAGLVWAATLPGDGRAVGSSAMEK